MKFPAKIVGALCITLALISLILFYFYFNPQALDALLANFSRFPRPGSCLILEEKYCQNGKLIENPSLYNGLLVVFKVPKGAMLFAPVSGFCSQTPTFFFIKDKTSKEMAKYPGTTITVADEPTAKATKAIYNFVYFKENENPCSIVQRGDVIGWVAGEPIDFLGDYNLAVGISKQSLIEGKAFFESADEELKEMLNIR